MSCTAWLSSWRAVLRHPTMAVRPWMARARRPATGTSWRSFNGATAVRPWMARPPVARAPAASRGFNGATAVRPGMAVHRRQVCAAHGLQWGHGREAMDGRAPAVRRYLGAGSFNGATAVRPWMVQRRSVRYDARVGLQWGHGREAMDGRYMRFDMITPDGGLQWGHGREAMDGNGAASRLSTASCFNGATAVRPWMGVQELREQAAFGASMGPRP